MLVPAAWSLAGLLALQALPSQSDLDARQQQARRAPLFASDSALPVVVRADIATLKRERPDTVELDGWLVIGRGEAADTVALQVRARGNFRRDRRHCEFPPLRLDVPRGAVEGTAFEGQDKLKLVTPCREGRGSYQDLVLKEYLAYRLLSLHTDAAYRVRLLDVTYDDVSGENDPEQALAFVIEDDEAMAARNRAVPSEWEAFHPATMDDWQAAVVDLFQFMIGNTDWESAYFHNVDMILDDGGRYLVVPYDFDFSGLVEAPYARPDPQFPIADVRTRLYRGFCRDEVDAEALRSHFVARRAEAEALVREFEPLGADARQRTLDYLETFYRVLESPGRYRRAITGVCRRMPSDDA